MTINGNEVPIQPGVFFGQMAYVLCGLFLLLLGAAIFYTIAYWRLHGQRVEGVIIGIRRQGAQIRNVYQYVPPEGVLCQATALQGSGSLKGRETGRRVDIRVRPDHPGEAHEAAAPMTWGLALGLVLCGAWLTYDSVTEWKHSVFTWIFLAAVALFVGRKLWRRLVRLLTNMQSRIGATDVWSTLPIEAAGNLTPSSQPTRLQIRGANPGRSGVIFCIAGLVILATAYIPVHKLLRLRAGTRTQGTVVQLHSNTSLHHSYAVYPTVDYTNENGTTVRFLDHAGSNPSPYKIGDHVTVLYQPGKPNTAMVDYGVHNWEPVAGLLILGTVLTSLGFMTLRNLYGSANQERVAGLRNAGT